VAAMQQGRYARHGRVHSRSIAQLVEQYGAEEIDIHQPMHGGGKKSLHPFIGARLNGIFLRRLARRCDMCGISGPPVILRANI